MRFILGILVITLISCGTKKQQQEQQFLKDISINQIDGNVEALLEDTLINSLSIGIYYNGKEITKHYGELDKGQKNQPTNKTIYEIASVTKTFVGTIIAQAEIEGKLSIEDDIRKYIGKQYKNLEFETNPIRIKHLLTHTSELPRFLPENINDLFTNMDDELPFKLAEIEKAYSKSKFLKDLENVSITAAPGTRFAYSNADTELAAYILEQIYNKSFDELLIETICKKANMPNTRIRLNRKQKENLANGYFGGSGRIAPHMSTSLWGASGAGKSTIVDLLNYIKLQLDKQNKPVQKTHQTLYDKEIIFGDPDNKIGYFWIINKDEDFGKFLSHHGGANGTQNWLVIYPEIGLGISIISNQGHFQTGGKLWNIIEVITNEIRKNHSKD
ncbi:serine hydrolase domain-containing protein [uncultured Aquimarina sp.]|uniref:serine hydrolase domain-containing protein n=1 Tax=uncultured Aquimarina sp. TaxID=575652 RepID=UPI0026187A71|nr:serine hydrolase domain-containing protein [uncultured Aquimarina sp.]